MRKVSTPKGFWVQDTGMRLRGTCSRKKPAEWNTEATAPHRKTRSDHKADRTDGVGRTQNTAALSTCPKTRRRPPEMETQFIAYWLRQGWDSRRHCWPAEPSHGWTASPAVSGGRATSKHRPESTWRSSRLRPLCVHRWRPSPLEQAMMRASPSVWSRHIDSSPISVPALLDGEKPPMRTGMNECSAAAMMDPSAGSSYLVPSRSVVFQVATHRWTSAGFGLAQRVRRSRAVA